MVEAWNEMKAPLANRYFAALLVTIAVLSLAPTLAHATQTETITVNMTGQANAIGSGLSGASTLNFTADAYNNSNHWLIIQNVTGSLQISSTTFQLTGGQGSISNFGAAAIFADTNSGKDQLILQGTLIGQTLTFDSPSQLTSTAYLSLSGTINENTGSTGGLSMNPTNTVENVTSLTTGLGNNTQVTNSTATSTLEPQNTTNTQSQNVASTTSANSTLSTTLNSSTNSTISASGNVPPSSGMQTPANVTVTTTQYLNQTISVTQTVANVTISYTVTHTVANTTISQGNVTTTVNATSTNTTSTGT
jgi:hypothetical protein